MAVDLGIESSRYYSNRATHTNYNLTYICHTNTCVLWQSMPDLFESPFNNEFKSRIKTSVTANA
jgi:hypothetical protein